MQIEPLAQSIAAARARQAQAGAERSHVIYLSPQGRPLTHAKAEQLSQQPGLILLCGRYEGVDERLIQREVDEEISIGDYVLSGGELPAMVLMDAVVRLLPGVLNDVQSAYEDSFVDGLLDCPHYTRPEDYQGMRVPDVLLSGNHALIAKWRLKQALGRTMQRRPDLLQGRVLTKQESRLLAGTSRNKISRKTRSNLMDLIQKLEQEEIARLGKTLPEFAPGDTVVVQVKVKEGNRERLQAYEGVVIAKKNAGLNSAFTVRKMSAGEGVERTFQTYSPLVASVEVKRRGDVRRAKLYYLRGRTGKSARIKEKLPARKQG